MKIILFEDTNDYQDGLCKAIQRALVDRGKVVLFGPTKADKKGCIHEEQLAADLSDPKYAGANLFVVDRDLSALPNYSGLSEQVVRSVADKLNVPECGYARGDKEDHELINPELREGRVTVSLARGNEAFADQVMSIVYGFGEIEGELPGFIKSAGRKTPGKLLASILKRPQYGEKISLYASGDQNRLQTLLKVSANADERNRRLGLFFGYWLWDSVLRYPGVVVNNIAAASHLNIDPADFEKEEVQKPFDDARYRGPFAGAREPIWWRGMLDDLIAKSKAKDGREYAQKFVNSEIRPCCCTEDPNLRAGYYCMLSNKPVSLEKSKAGLAWFPRGADLARISNSKYEEVIPWLAA